MYDTTGPMAETVGKQQCKPDYQEMAANVKKRLDIFKHLRGSLIEFVEVVGSYSMKREPSSIPELLGKLVIDIRQYEREYDALLKKIEEEG